METVNALNLQPAAIKKHQLKRHYLARVDELKAQFSGRWSKDSKPEPLEVNSDSGSVASSDAAHRFLQLASRCDSSENEPLASDVPTCRSLTLESDDGDESVGSSSVAEPAIGRRAGAAQDEYACPTASKHAVPSFLTEDPTDNDNDSSEEVPCLACNAEVWELDDDERWEVLVLRQDHFDEVVPNIYSPPADQYISAHTDQSHLLGATSDILSLTLGSAGVFFLCSENL